MPTRPATCHRRTGEGRLLQQVGWLYVLPLSNQLKWGSDAVEPPEIDVDNLAERLAAGAVLIDVRRQDEHDESHLPEAILIPLDQLPDRIDEVPEADEVLVICRSGGRSAAACEFLAGSGRPAINVAGGMLAWVDSGRPYGGSLGMSTST